MNAQIADSYLRYLDLVGEAGDDEYQAEQRTAAAVLTLAQAIAEAVKPAEKPKRVRK